jgi:hypothetical protein
MVQDMNILFTFLHIVAAPVQYVNGEGEERKPEQ